MSLDLAEEALAGCAVFVLLGELKNPRFTLWFPRRALAPIKELVDLFLCYLGLR